MICSNGSGSREATTIKSPQQSRNGDISTTARERVPMPPTMNDKYFDLMAILLERIDNKTPANYHKVIVKSEPVDELNPTMSEMLEVKLG
jgi:hypothetical protein